MKSKFIFFCCLCFQYHNQDIIAKWLFLSHEAFKNIKINAPKSTWTNYQNLNKTGSDLRLHDLPGSPHPVLSPMESCLYFRFSRFVHMGFGRHSLWSFKILHSNMGHLDDWVLDALPNFYTWGELLSLLPRATPAPERGGSQTTFPRATPRACSLHGAGSHYDQVGQAGTHVCREAQTQLLMPREIYLWQTSPTKYQHGEEVVERVWCHSLSQIVAQAGKGII